MHCIFTSFGSFCTGAGDHLCSVIIIGCDSAGAGASVRTDCMSKDMSLRYDAARSEPFF